MKLGRCFSLLELKRKPGAEEEVFCSLHSLTLGRRITGSDGREPVRGGRKEWDGLCTRPGFSQGQQKIISCFWKSILAYHSLNQLQGWLHHARAPKLLSWAQGLCNSKREIGINIGYIGINIVVAPSNIDLQNNVLNPKLGPVDSLWIEITHPHTQDPCCLESYLWGGAGLVRLVNTSWCQELACV